MRKTIFILLLWMVATLPTQARVPHLLPQPKLLTEKTGEKLFLLGRDVTIDDPTDCWLLRKVFEDTRCEVRGTRYVGTRVRRYGGTGKSGRVVVRLVSDIAGSYDYRLEDYEAETYRLDVSENLIAIDAITPTGVVRAAQTLQQLAEGYQSRSAIEPVTIVDWPSFKLRGFMHDSGRSFIPVEDLKRQIRLLSRFKVNTFHWHLTDNQAWRFEVKSYPQLTRQEAMTRHAGHYYTQDECRELEEYARYYGITVIPEIDIPGHSAAFERAMGHSMQTRQGLSELKTILAEVAGAFPHAPYIHIGGDEVSVTMPELLPTLMQWVRTLGKRVVAWRPGTVSSPDMVQLWSTAGKLVKGVPNIDCRYTYLNHFDLFADVVAIYLSNIYYSPQGSEEIAGTMACVWNDHVLPTADDILRQNAFYPAVIALASRAWQGGGAQYIEASGVSRPPSDASNADFVEWEKRFLFHKSHSLKDEPICYVRQSHVRFLVCYRGKEYQAAGAGVYLNHTWHNVLAGLLPEVRGARCEVRDTREEAGDTAFVSTRVFSPEEQKVGAMIELQNYSRSEADEVPEYGRWDCKGSRLWLNGVEILAPIWHNHGMRVDRETPLADENVAARKPIVLHLQKGWNTVKMVLPYTDVAGIRLNKWMFTFVFTDLEGRRALDFEYSAE